MGTSGSTCTQITANAIATDDNPTCMPIRREAKVTL